MNYYPSGEEQERNGVCCVCGKMVHTIIVNKLSDQRKEELKKLYDSLGVEGGEQDDCDFREVTSCCKVEDFIPAVYAVKCQKCGEWMDRRFGKLQKGGSYVCPACSDRS